MHENRTFLKKVAIFQDLADSELQSVAEMFKERQYKRNEIIFVEEDTGQYNVRGEKRPGEGFSDTAQWIQASIGRTQCAPTSLSPEGAM